MQTVAESWLVYRLTGSAFLLGAVGFANRIPVFLFSSVGGAIADRYNRHHIVIATQAASMLLASLLAVLTLTHVVQVWHLMAIATLLGIVNAFDIPEEGAGWSLIGKIFEALATYVVARLSLILPAVALDQKLTLSTVWDLSEGNGWRLAVVVGGLPWLLNYLQGLAFSETDMIPAILRSVVYCTLLIVEVAALSLSYKALTPQLSEVSL